MDRTARAADIVSANLRRLDDTLGELLEARRGHLYELALAIAEGGLPLDTLRERLNDYTPARQPLRNCLYDNAPYLHAAMTGLSVIERVELCRMLCAALPEPLSPALLLDPIEPIADEATGLIAYLQNAFTDRAYHAFSRRMPRARSQYHESYGAACEAVSTGSCAACILPIEHAQDGKLLGFYRLIDRYELKITATCDIAQANGVESRFALLQKNLDPVLPDRALSDHLELSVSRGTGYTLGAVLDAAACLGLGVRRVDSIPLAYAGDSFAYHTVLNLPDRRLLVPFLLYLALDIPQYDPIGIYAHIPE